MNKFGIIYFVAMMFTVCMIIIVSSCGLLSSNKIKNVLDELKDCSYSTEVELQDHYEISVTCDDTTFTVSRKK